MGRGPCRGLFFFGVMVLAAGAGLGGARPLEARAAGGAVRAVRTGAVRPVARLAAARPGAAHRTLSKFVLVTLDGLPVGWECAHDTMPTLAALGARGVRCAAATGPATPFAAWAELLTGAGAERSGVRDEYTRGVDAGAPALAAALEAGGVRTLALPADAVAHAGSGLARGFARYDAAAPALEDSARVDSALAWLAAPAARFAWLGLSMDAHAEPWRRVDGLGPAEPALRVARARRLDDALARLVAGLARAGVAKSALVVVAGAGGAPDGAGRVPLVFARAGAGGGAEAGRVLAAPARLADVAPTLLAAAGARARGFGGVNRLAPGAAAERPARVARTTAAAPADPLQLPPACAAAARALLATEPAPPDSARLAAWDSLCAACGGARLALERAVALSRAGREKRAADDLKDAVAAAPADPRPALAYADHLLRSGRHALVPPVLADLPDTNPWAALAHWRLAVAWAGVPDFVAAESEARQAARLATPTAAARELPATLHALDALADSAAAAPNDGLLHLRYGQALGQATLFNAAYEQFHAARALLPGDARPDYELALCLERQGRPQHAAPTLERALEAQPDFRPARLALAEALLELGRRPEARAQLERLLATGPLEARALYNLACLRATAGEPEGALGALEQAVAAGYARPDVLATDPDLETLRGGARFQRLLARATGQGGGK